MAISKEKENLWGQNHEGAKNRLGVASRKESIQRPLGMKKRNFWITHQRHDRDWRWKARTGNNLIRTNWVFPGFPRGKRVIKWLDVTCYGSVLVNLMSGNCTLHFTTFDNVVYGITDFLVVSEINDDHAMRPSFFQSVFKKWWNINSFIDCEVFWLHK